MTIRFGPSGKEGIDFLIYSADLGSIPAGEVASLSENVPGLGTGTALVNPNGSLTDGLAFSSAGITVADTLVTNFANLSAGAIDPAEVSLIGFIIRNANTGNNEVSRFGGPSGDILIASGLVSIGHGSITTRTSKAVSISTPPNLPTQNGQLCVVNPCDQSVPNPTPWPAEAMYGFGVVSGANQITVHLANLGATQDFGDLNYFVDIYNCFLPV